MLIVLMLVKAQNMSEDKQHVQQEEEKNVLKETLSDPNTGCCELLERRRKKSCS